MLKFLSFILVAFFVQGSLSQMVYDGQCPKTNTLKEFNIDAYMGLWYGWAKYPLQVPDLEGRKCVYDNYTYLGDDKLSVNGAGVFINSGIETFTLWDGKVRGPGQFALLYDENQSLDTTNYYVLGTDYEHYTVIYNCQNLNTTQYTIDVWVFSRDRFLADEYADIAKNILVAQNVDVSILEFYNHTDCPPVTSS